MVFKELTKLVPGGKGMTKFLLELRWGPGAPAARAVFGWFWCQSHGGSASLREPLRRELRLQQGAGSSRGEAEQEPTDSRGAGGGRGERRGCPTGERREPLPICCWSVWGGGCVTGCWCCAVRGCCVCQLLPVPVSLQAQGLFLIQVLWEEPCCSSRSCSQGTSVDAGAALGVPRSGVTPGLPPGWLRSS